MGDRFRRSQVLPLAFLVHVLIQVGARFASQGQKTLHNSCCCAHWADEWLTRPRLSDRVVAHVALLILKGDCDVVGEFEIGVVVLHNFVVFPKDQVFQAQRVRAAFAGGFQILATAHGEEESKNGQLVEGDQPWFGARAPDHLFKEFERDRPLLPGRGIGVSVSFDLTL